MKKGYTHIAYIIDSSGSMSSVKEPTIEGFNNFLQEQKMVPGEATFSLIKFSDEIETLYNFVHLQDVPLLNDNNYKTSGWTALRDAIGLTIDSIGKKLASMGEKDRPERILVICQTDGFENRSKLYSVSQINQMVTHQKEKYNWQFTFMGATEQSILNAASYGISGGNRILYNSEALFIGESYTSLNSLTTSQRLCSVSDMSSMGFTDEDRKKQEKKLTK